MKSRPFVNFFQIASLVMALVMIVVVHLVLLSFEHAYQKANCKNFLLFIYYSQ